MPRRWNKGRFDAIDEDPMGPLANLLDLMLVFACGLIAALIAMSGDLENHFNQPSQVVKRGTELAEKPEKKQQGGAGFQEVGKVYKDPETGKLILISE